MLGWVGRSAHYIDPLTTKKSIRPLHRSVTGNVLAVSSGDQKVRYYYTCVVVYVYPVYMAPIDPIPLRHPSKSTQPNQTLTTSTNPSNTPGVPVEAAALGGVGPLAGGQRRRLEGRRRRRPLT